MFTVAPQIFGTNFSSAPGQAAFRTFIVIASLVLAIFFFGIVITPVPNVGGAVRISSAAAAATLTVENLPSANYNIRTTTAADLPGVSTVVFGTALRIKHGDL